MVARVGGEPRLHLGVGVRVMVLEDHVNLPPTRGGPLDPFRKRQEFKLPLPRQTAPHHLPQAPAASLKQLYRKRARPPCSRYPLGRKHASERALAFIES